jgi:hypothetical protein
MEIRHPAIVIALSVAFGTSISSKADKVDDYIMVHMQPC